MMFHRDGSVCNDCARKRFYGGKILFICTLNGERVFREPPQKLLTLFHKAWGQAKVSPEYDKKVWTELDQLIFDLLQKKD